MIDVCLVGDCRESMREMIAQGVRVQMCVTSPPYWGLRDYGTAQWEGGEAECDHARPAIPHTGLALAAERADGNHREKSGTRSAKELQPFRDLCGKCGASRIDAQLGLERTPEEYVANMVEVFRLVRELLADDGTLWLNLGDSYASNGERQTGRNDTDRETPGGRGGSFRGGERIGTGQHDGLKPKDLCGIPWRVAFALQADGWYLRSDIIWSKPNPMPESVTDRPTKAHEYLFLLSKRERYFYDADAIREPHVRLWNERNGGSWSHPVSGENHGKTGYAHAGAYPLPNEIGRNRRTVWTVTTEPYAEAHFATFPTALIEPCVLAGTSSKGHCPACGKGWGRVTERSGAYQAHWAPSRQALVREGLHGDRGVIGTGMVNTYTTTGWKPGCACNLEPVPGIVLDPFMGSGTTAQVAQDLGRHWLGCELNGTYMPMQNVRTAQLALPLSA